MLWPITKTLSFDPFSQVRNLQREMNRLFEDSGSSNEAFPAVNMWSNEKEVVLSAEIPGMDPKDINISVKGDEMLFEGERKADEPGEKAKYHRRERGYGKFIRAFRLPFNVDAGKVSAVYKNGIVKVTMPRAEESKPRKISISGE